MQPWATEFYSSTAWKKCRSQYLQQVGGLCEDCLEQGLYTPAEIIHHTIELTPVNINDPSISLNPEHLRAVCRECHAKAHGARQRRYKVDEMGRVQVR